jgi:hypothetical protein
VRLKIIERVYRHEGRKAERSTKNNEQGIMNKPARLTPVGRGIKNDEVGIRSLFNIPCSLFDIQNFLKTKKPLISERLFT